jgi:hypothetical protein
MDQATITFLDLLRRDPALSVGERQNRASEELPDWVRSSALRWLTQTDSVNGTGDKLVVGVAVWSRYDLTLLDDLNAFAAANPDVRVYVFDVDRIGGQFDRFVPGIGDVGQTPVVGVWAGGVLVAKDTGFAGRQLARQFISDSAVVR